MPSGAFAVEPDVEKLTFSVWIWGDFGRLWADSGPTFGQLLADLGPTLGQLWADPRPSSGRQADFKPT